MTIYDKIIKNPLILILIKNHEHNLKIMLMNYFKIDFEIGEIIGFGIDVSQ